MKIVTDDRNRPNNQGRSQNNAPSPVEVGFTFNKNDFPISTKADYRFYTIGIVLAFALMLGLFLHRTL
jgi:hypothetical protein